MKSEKSVPVLIKILRDKKEYIDTRYTAAGSLANLNKNEILAEFLKDTDTQVQYACAFALSKRNDPRAIPVLIEAIRDTDNPVVFRCGAIEYLKEKFPEQISSELQEEIEKANKNLTNLVGSMH